MGARVKFALKSKNKKGGFLGIERKFFEKTKYRSELKDYYKQIRIIYGIKWNDVNYSDLDKSNHSAIAGILYHSLLLDTKQIVSGITNVEQCSQMGTYFDSHIFFSN